MSLFKKLTDFTIFAADSVCQRPVDVDQAAPQGAKSDLGLCHFSVTHCGQPVVGQP